MRLQQLSFDRAPSPVLRVITTAEDSQQGRMASIASSVFSPPALDDSARQIRLLRFLPNCDDDTIQCEMSVHDLQSVSDGYIAISYTWGDTTTEKAIMINALKTQVRGNCWYALRQLRAHNPLTSFWVDTLCINQEAHAEKSKQVGQMHRIYSHARLVAVCLGGPGPDTKLLDSLNDDWKRIFALNKDEAGPLQYLCKRPYFSRLWTVQENLLAQDLFALIGTSQYPRMFLINAVRRACEYFPEELGDLRLLDFVDDLALYRSLRFPQTPWSTAEARDLASMVVRYSARQCFEPRDRVYALQSLVQHKTDETMSVDYTKTLFVTLVDYISTFTSIDCFGDFSTVDPACEKIDIDLRDDIRTTSSELRPVLDSISYLVQSFSDDSDFVNELRNLYDERPASGNKKPEPPARSNYDTGDHIKLACSASILAIHRINTSAGDVLAAQEFSESSALRSSGTQCLKLNPDSDIEQLTDITAVDQDNRVVLSIHDPDENQRVSRYLVPNQALHGDILIKYSTSTELIIHHVLCRSTRIVGDLLVLGQVDALCTPNNKSNNRSVSGVNYHDTTFTLHVPPKEMIYLANVIHDRAEIPTWKDLEWSPLLEKESSNVFISFESGCFLGSGFVPPGAHLVDEYHRVDENNHVAINMPSQTSRKLAADELSSLPMMTKRWASKIYKGPSS